MKTVAIAGTGLVGRLLALSMVELGYRVTLIDREGPYGTGSCSWAGAGMLAPWAELEKAEPQIGDMGCRSLTLWPEILDRLGGGIFFQREGSLVVAHRQDLGDLEAFARRVRAKLPQPDLIEDAKSQRIAELEPELAGRFHHGLYFRDEGQLEPRTLLPALVETLLNEVVEWRKADIERVVPGRVYDRHGYRDYDLVIDSRGLGARTDMPDLRGVRGELLRIHAPEVRINRPIRLMHPRYPLYVVPRPAQTYLIGATSIESEHRGPITVRSCLELLSAAYSLHPGFAEGELLETVADCRPALPDNLPQITREPGLIRANGLYRHGFLIAPVFCEDVLAAVAEICPLKEVKGVTGSS